MPIAVEPATNWQAIIMFGVFVVFTLGTCWAHSKRVRSVATLLHRDGNITGFHGNGTAIAGDYMSRRVISRHFRAGVCLRFNDGAGLYSLGFLVGW